MLNQLYKTAATIVVQWQARRVMLRKVEKDRAFIFSNLFINL